MSDPALGAGEPLHGEYVRAIEQFFVLVRRQGLMLSPRDWQIASRWGDAGIPLRVAIRGVLRGVEAFRSEHGPSKQLPATLAYYAPAVDDEMLLHTRKELAHEESDDDEERSAALTVLVDLLARLEQVGKAERHDAVRSAYRRLWRGLTLLAQAVERGEASSTVDELIVLDGRLLDDVFAALPEGERAELDAGVDAALARERAMLGEQGLIERRRALLAEALAERYGLFRPWEGIS
jgi:hypothetical protein